VRSNGNRADPGGRDPVNELYDRGCDLVEAALAIRMVTSGSGVAPAVPALLACIECALDELSSATGSLTESRRLVSGERSGANCDAPAEAAVEHLRRVLASLEAALRDARERAGTARILGSQVVESLAAP
jgi:hypothetical protein